MASNPYVNRVDYVAGGVTHTLIDITNDTVTPSTLLQGYTAHDASGAAIVGTAAQDNTFVVTVSGNEQTEMWEPDCTYAEVLAAVNAGKEIVMRVGEGYNATADCEWDSSSQRLIYAVFYAFGSTQVYQDVYFLSSSGLNLNYHNMTLKVSGTKAITASGTTSVAQYEYVSVDAGSAAASATKGTVSNHAVTVTPRVARTAGWITAGIDTSGTPATVSASELVSGTYTVTGSGTVDVTNYASISVASGSATASATKGTVSNHSIAVTPSATRTKGYISNGTATGVPVTVSASELVSGSETKTANGTYDVTNLAEVVVDVSGGGSSSMQVGTKTATLNAAASSISFTGLSGNPLAFVVTSSTDQSTGGTTSVAVAYDGTSLHGMDVTTQAEADTGYTKTYSGGTLTVTATTATFEANEYKLVYAYGGSSSDIHTADVQVGSGATSITFTGLSGRPLYFSCVFKSSFSTSSGYQRVIDVVNDGTNTYGHAFDSSAKAQTSWSYTYSGGSLTISSTGTNNGGYFHQPGYYGLVYAVDPNALSYQNKTGVGATTSSQTIYADAGYDALESVQIDAVSQTNLTAANIKNGTTVTIYNGTTNLWSVTGTYTGGGGGSASVATTTWSNSSNTTTSHQFTNLSGTPKAAFLRCTSSLSRSSNSSNYFIADMVWNGTSCKGNSFRRSNGTYANVTSGYTVTTGSNSITFTSSGTSTTNPGSFYNGSYELVYVY